MTAPTTTPTLDVDALRTAPEVHAALAAVLAEDIEWLRHRSRAPRARSDHGRESVLAMLRRPDRGRHRDDRRRRVRPTAIAARCPSQCTMPDGRVLLTNALLELRDGNITRWYGVEAWDA